MSCIKWFLPLLTPILLGGYTSNAIAQEPDTISMVKTLGTTYHYHGVRLTRVQLRTVLKKEPAAFTVAKKGDGFYAMDLIIGGVGSFFLGAFLGELLAADNANWTTLALGSGLVMVSIPFNIAWKDHQKHAVRIFNTSRQTTSYQSTSPRFALSFTGNGIRLSF